MLFEGREIENRIFVEKLFSMDADLQITESESTGWKIFNATTLTGENTDRQLFIIDNEQV